MLRTRSHASPARALAIATLALASLGGVASCSKTEEAVSTSPPSSTTTTSAAPLTKEQLVTQANAICRVPKAESEKIDQELRAKYPDPKSVPDADFQVLLKDTVARLLPLYKKEVADLKLLTPPPADAAMIAKGITILETGLKDLEADPGAIARPGISAFQEGVDYGLTDCFTAGAKFVPVASAVQ
jgi:hypothetical protein